jgi:hypothetical protein
MLGSTGPTACFTGDPFTSGFTMSTTGGLQCREKAASAVVVADLPQPKAAVQLLYKHLVGWCWMYVHSVVMSQFCCEISACDLAHPAMYGPASCV